MTGPFVGTSAWSALLDRRSRAHARVAATIQAQQGRLVAEMHMGEVTIAYA